MKMIRLQDHIVPLNQTLLAKLDEGVTLLRFEIAYPEVQRLARIMFTLFAMHTIGASRDYARYIELPEDGLNPTEDFIYLLGYCQLYAYFELKHPSPLPLPHAAVPVPHSPSL